MLEDEGVVDVDGLADLVVHGVDVSLVDGHALPGQRRGVVDGDVVELRVVLPVLILFTQTQFTVKALCSLDTVAGFLQVSSS